MRFLYIFIFLFSIQASGFSHSQEDLYRNINLTGIDTVLKITPYQANRVTIHKLGPNGDHKSIRGYNVEDLPDRNSEEEVSRLRVDALSYFRRNQAYPDIAIKIGNSLVCYASSPIRTNNAIHGTWLAPKKVDMSHYSVNDFNLSWYSSQWRYCIIFPYKIDEVIEALEEEELS